MNYKGYFGTAEFDDEAKIFHGEVEGLRDVVTYQGRTVDELVQAFHDSIDDYLEFCSKRGEAPEKPVSGKLLLRLPTAVHRYVLGAAKSEGVSINAYIVGKIVGSGSIDIRSFVVESGSAKHLKRGRRESATRIPQRNRRRDLEPA